MTSKGFSFLVAVFALLWSMIPTTTVAYTITFDDYPATDDGTQIGEEYADLGIHFITSTSGLTDPGIAFSLSTILPPGPENEIFWYPPSPPPGCYYESYPYPTSNYLALAKPRGAENVTTGVAMQFDTLCSKMSFLFRRPGNNNTTAPVTMAFFDTSQSNLPFYTTQETAYVCTPPDLDSDEDGWRKVSLAPPGNFDLVLFYGEKKFAIDDLEVTVSAQESHTIYFPHVAIANGWGTEIAVINTSPDTTLAGTLRAYDGSGSVVSTAIPINLAAHGRRQIDVATEFTGGADIRYLILETASDSGVGYSKFYKDGLYRSSIPASGYVNSADILVSHIASNDNWWTGLALVNTNDTAKGLTIDFDNGTSKSVTINAKEHKSFTIKSLFDGLSQPEIDTAVIKNSSGIIGLELFGNDTQLSGIPLIDDTTNTLYYPHVADNAVWWTGVVGYNSLSTTTATALSPYEVDGTALPPQSQDLSGNERTFGQPESLGLPEGTAWLDMDATGGGLTGFELFGTRDGAQLAGFFGLGAASQEGVFAKIEVSGWTGIAFVNTEAASATVTLTAYNDSGLIAATITITLDAYEKVVDQVVNIFAGQDISTATYIGYTADRDVVGFQLNGSVDDTMLDCLPSM